MTRDDILRMASEAGNSVAPQGDTRDPLDVYLHEVLVFADLIKKRLIDEGYRKCAEGQRTTQYCSQLEAAVAAEREACAKLADAEADEWPGNSDGLYASRNIAAAIRARGENT